MAAYCNWTQCSSHRHGVPAQLLASFNMVLQADVNYELSSPSPKSAVISALLSSVHTATWFGHHKCVDAPVLEKTDDRHLQCCRRGVMLSGWDTSRDSRHIPAGAPSSRLLFHQKTVIHQNRTLLVECAMCSITFVRKDFSDSGETCWLALERPKERGVWMPHPCPPHLGSQTLGSDRLPRQHVWPQEQGKRHCCNQTSVAARAAGTGFWA